MDALELGALDFVHKPDSAVDCRGENFRREFLRTLNVVANSKLPVFAEEAKLTEEKGTVKEMMKIINHHPVSVSGSKVVAIASSTYPLIFSLHKNRISLHRIEFQRKSGDIKKEMFEWNKIRGSRRRMLKIAICDDEQPIREYLKRLVKKCTEGEIRLFADGGELLADPTAFDLILLDISLNREQNAAEPDGMETARKIRERSDALIIFVTALREYVFEGYDVGAFHYLLKPIDEQKFTEVMDRAICQIRSKKNVEPLVIKVGGNYVRIPVDDILYAENQARKIMLHTKSKKEPYCFYEKMEVLEQKLGDRFFRSHRGFLVNLQEVARYDNSNIELKNGESVFLAKQKYNDFVTAYMKYLRKV